jgi:hypothetical protein
MIMTPSWLPGLINTDGIWDVVLLRLYSIFQKDFISDGCAYDGLPITWDHRKVDSPYEEGFWHLISKDDPMTYERLFDPRRAQKISWCKPCIVNWADVNIKIWNIEEKGRIQVYIWLEHFDYLVILQKRKHSFFLVTAYHVGGDRTKIRLRTKYNNRIT